MTTDYTKEQKKIKDMLASGAKSVSIKKSILDVSSDFGITIKDYLNQFYPDVEIKEID